MTAITKLPGSLLDDLTNFTFANANVTGNLSAGNANLGNLATANFIAGTLTTAVQPNITSVGTLGNLTVTSNASIGNIKTDNLLYSNGNPWTFAATPVGSNTEIQFNNAGVFGASANLTFNSSTNTLIVDKISANGAGLSSLSGANVSGAVANATYAIDAGTAQTAVSVAGANITGQVNNAAVAGTVYTNAQPNITSVGTLTSLTVTGNISSGNANLGNAVTANYFIGNGSLLTGLSASYANSNVENYLPTHTGNVSANYFIGDGSQLTNINPTAALNVTLDSFTGNGVQTAFTLSVQPISENHIVVNIDGVIQLKTAYSLSGSVLTFTSAPDNGVPIEVQTLVATGGSAVVRLWSYTGNGVQTAFSVSSTATANNLLVTENGILQMPITDYTVSGNSVNFVGAPSNNIAIQIREIPSIITSAASTANTVVNNAQPNITSVGTLSTLTVSGDVTANNFIGNGSQLTGISAGVSNARVVGYNLVFGG
jgi:hypothetical protein